jgi:hypothetical protein
MMNRVQFCFGVALLFGIALAGPRLLQAQQPADVASDFGGLYGQGVNAYFAGRSSDAESHLSQALALNPHDPRAYYFRALSLLRLGRLDEARGDMMVGASLEAQRPNRFGVGRALERVQGGHRLTLEQYRRQGRAFAASTASMALPRQSQPARAQVADDSFVLRNRIVVPIDRLLEEGGPRPLSADELAARRQRTNSRPAQRATRPVEAPASARVGDDPFGDDPADAVAEDAAPSERMPSQPAETADEPVADPAVEAELNPFDDL